MKMIIGGAFQGKTSYAKERFKEIQWVKGQDADLEDLLKCEGVIGFHNFIRNEMIEKKDLGLLAEMIIEKNPSIIIVSDEVGYGIVPMDAFEREYREQVGRICTRLASNCDEVVRVICGIGMVIKGA